MKKLLLILMVITFAFAGDFYFKNLEVDDEVTCNIDTIENVTTDIASVGNKNQAPTSFTITHIVAPTSDSVRCHFALWLSNDKSNWYSYGNIDSIEIANSADATIIGNSTITTIPDYKFFKVTIQSFRPASSTKLDTFSVKLQKSIKY